MAPVEVALAEDLTAELEDDVEIYLLATPDVTGFFEVEITEDAGETSKQMIHSRMKGDGFVDSQKKMDKILAAIQEAIDAAGRQAKL